LVVCRTPDALRNDGGVSLAEGRASRFREFDARDLDLPFPFNPLWNHKSLLLLAADAMIEKGNAEAATLLEPTNERHTGRTRNFDIDLER
jgi:hypothetical protein